MQLLGDLGTSQKKKISRHRGMLWNMEAKNIFLLIQLSKEVYLENYGGGGGGRGASTSANTGTRT